MDRASDSCDVVVMGGGPGGCACGIFLAQAGLKVVILEGEKHPRHHVGESLLPASMPILERLGVGIEEMTGRFQPKFGARFYDPVGDRLAVFGFDWGWNGGSPSYQVMREEFDGMLAEKARAAGCEVVEEAMVAGVEEELERPRVKVRDGRVWECGFLVDATGRGAVMARKRKTLRVIQEYGRVGIYNYFADVAPHDGEDRRYITMYLFEGGWVWLIPVRDGRTSVGVVLGREVRSQTPEVRSREGKSREEGIFWEVVRGMPRLWDRLKGARATEAYRANADYSYAVGEKFGERFVLVGDAAGFLDPIFSSGVHLALASAEKAAAGVTEKLRTGSDAGLAAYAGFMDQGYRVFEAFVERFYHGGMVENLFFMESKPAVIHAAITRILAGHVWEAGNPVLKLIGVGRADVAS